MEHFETAIEQALTLMNLFGVSQILACIVQDVTEGCREGSIELDFHFIFFSTGFVEVGVDKRLHSIYVENMLGNFMMWIR